MKGVNRLIKCKRNVRRFLAAGFVFIMFVEIGSHAFVANYDPGGLDASNWCAFLHHTSPAADCPHKRHPRTPQAGLFDEVIPHCAVLSGMCWPNKGTFRTTELTAFFPADPIDRALAPPFQPPKQL